MSKSPIEYLRRGLRTPPRQTMRWAVRQFRAATDHRVSPRLSRRLTEAALLHRLDAPDMDALWRNLAKAPFATHTGTAPEGLDAGEVERVLARARAAAERKVDLLGSGPIRLSPPIDWHTDFKSGHSWPREPYRSLRVVDPDNDADVKIPWELSRLQWLIPTGQAYRLTGDDAHAEAARTTIEEWIAANPLGIGINWACAMEPAIRIVVLSWLFHALHDAPSWRDSGFRYRFVKCLYEHGDFVARHLEWADVNGNHLLTDAVGLLFAGNFLGRGHAPAKWRRTGWRILADELPRQVHADGVDFEASAAYHRFVLELGLFAVLYRLRRGESVDSTFHARLAAMARFTAAIAGPDGRAPLWGDSDDGRLLPLSAAPIDDHRAVVRLVGRVLEDTDLANAVAEPGIEAAWVFGETTSTPPVAIPPSTAFPDGGVYVMRTAEDRVFVDCGPVGMRGRGGHGHNDALAIDAALAGVPVLVDVGSYVYGASVEWRNRFRTTAAHNTPRVDGAEQNRLVRPDYLWTLHPDAEPDVRRWSVSPTHDIFVGAHTGYRRLPNPAVPVRTVILEKPTHRLAVIDRLESEGPHDVAIPYHLAAGIQARTDGPRCWRLDAPDVAFLLVWEGDDGWACEPREGWYSPAYGIKHPITVLEFRRKGSPAELRVGILPADNAPADGATWLRKLEDA